MPETAYEKLFDYILKKMRMSHIYQPVMIRELLTQGGKADVEVIAKALLSHDQSQIEYYGLRTKNMVGKVLSANGITEVERTGRNITGYVLDGAASLSSTENSELIRVCNEAIETFLEKRGDRVWSHRSSSAGYVSGTLRYEILKRAKFRCELCGISAEEKALEVDHILRRNLGGTDDESNLQALCYSCNAMKRDRDDTDFRGVSKL
jgi:ATP adenylyltransferase